MNRWSLLALAAAAQVSASAFQIGVGFLLPFVKIDLDLSTAQVAILPAALAAGLTLASFPAGTASDRVGERVILAGGLLVAGLSVSLAAMQTSFVLAAVLLAVAGLGAAPTHPAGSRLVLRLFSARERGFALGVRQTAVPVGGLLVAGAVAPIATALGWRPGLMSLSALLLATSLLIALLMAGEAKPVRVSRRGFWSDVPVLARNRDFRLANLAAMLTYAGQVAIYTYLSLYVLQGLGHDVPVAAAVLAAAQVGAAVGRLGSGAISDRLFHGRRRVPLMLFQVSALAAALVLAAVPAGGSPAVLVGIAGLAGATMVGWNTLAVALTAESAGPERAGGAAGLNTALLSGVFIVFPPLLGLLVDGTGTLRVVWLAAALSLAAALVATAVVRER